MSGEGIRPRLSSRGRSTNPRDDFDPAAGNRPSPKKNKQPSGYVHIRREPDTLDHGNESDTVMYSTAAIPSRGSHHHHHQQDAGANSYVPGQASMSIHSPRKRERMSPDSSLKIARQTERSSIRSIASNIPEKYPIKLYNHSSQATGATRKPSSPADLGNLKHTKPHPPEERLSSLSNVKTSTRPPPPERNLRQLPDLRPEATVNHEEPHSGAPEDTAMDNAPTPDDGNEDECMSNPGEPNKSLKKQPDSKPISQEQLAAEVKGIYAGLVLVEAKCVNVVKAQTEALRELTSGTKSTTSTPYADHWQALTALHRTLLHEHHDFFLASQHPSAASTLHGLALKYAMPARMWRHGIHSFLELLRQRLPDSWEYMVAFIYQSYQMMALLFETVPSFEETWIECLGDLARYRMAIEEDDPKIRETWTGVASYWYGKASDKSPNVGRLYHHLAILARTQALYQLSLYCRSLTAAVPFPSARESILTLLEPSLSRPMYNNLRQPAPDPWFIRFIALLYQKQQPFATANTGARSANPGNGIAAQSLTSLNQTGANFLHHLGAYLPHTEEWKKKGSYVAICLIGGLFLFGVATSSLRDLFVGAKDATEAQRRHLALLKESQGAMDTDSSSASSVETAKREADEAWRMTYSTFSVALGRLGESKVLPHIAVVLTFFLCLASTEQGHMLLDDDFPWGALARYLNFMLHQSQAVALDRVESPDFPEADAILPEDYTMNGQVWIQKFFPADFFKNMPADVDERTMEYPVTDCIRKERVLWLAVRLASIGEEKKKACWLTYSSMEREFSVSQP